MESRSYIYAPVCVQSGFLWFPLRKSPYPFQYSQSFIRVYVVYVYETSKSSTMITEVS